MKLNSTPQNEAVLSNVGQIGEFRIRNSAKAFGILSSGLYANKIRAVIREISCNAVDSHVAAGNTDTPFDVHLPNALEPWFSVRDYGIGLNADQVTEIFTVYFESTKTNSNDFIGALGLGSKSPFSYTDNFTVIAIKDGKKGVYTAFINNEGVPSIALMNEENSNEPAGVEIRFAVEDANDFYKFRDEASSVYKYFKLRPVVSGASSFKVTEPEYETLNIIPGVHSTTPRFSYSSYAVMGNIEYPIKIPNEQQVLGSLSKLLECNLVMEFDIGELDFQASREGLSYIPETIAAIKNKLKEVNAVLTKRIADEANAIENLWKRAEFLASKSRFSLWSTAVEQYVHSTKFPLFDKKSYARTFNVTKDEMATKYNIVVRAFTCYPGGEPSTLAASTQYDYEVGDYIKNQWHFKVMQNTQFVINDIKVGPLARAKYHWSNTSHLWPWPQGGSDMVYVLDFADKTKPMNTVQFFTDIYVPPGDQIHMASMLKEPEKAEKVVRSINVLKLTQRDHKGYQRSGDYVWREVNTSFNTFKSTETYYYLPLSGCTSLGVIPKVTNFRNSLQTSGLFSEEIYGIRKADIETIKKLSNWVNLDDHIRGKLENLTEVDAMGLVKSALDISNVLKYDIINKLNSNSPYAVLYNVFKDVASSDMKRKNELEHLIDAYKIKVKKSTTVNVNDLINKYKKDVTEIQNRYPLLKHLPYYVNEENNSISNYINAIDLLQAQAKQ